MTLILGVFIVIVKAFNIQLDICSYKQGPAFLSCIYYLLTKGAQLAHRPTSTDELQDTIQTFTRIHKNVTTK